MELTFTEKNPKIYWKPSMINIIDAKKIIGLQIFALVKFSL